MNLKDYLFCINENPDAENGFIITITSAATWDRDQACDDVYEDGFIDEVEAKSGIALSEIFEGAFEAGCTSPQALKKLTAAGLIYSSELEAFIDNLSDDGDFDDDSDFSFDEPDDE